MTTTAISPALRFVEESHEYFLDGRPVPSVTQVLKRLGFINAEWYSDDARERGKWIHEATALLDRGELDEDAAEVQARDWWPYVEAYKRFARECDPDLCDVECRVHDPIYGYAGTLDRTLFLRGEWALLDIKTGSPERWHALQTAAYARLRPNDGRTPKRFGLYLKADGTYRLEPFTNRQDESLFLNAVGLVHWAKGSQL